MSHPHHAAHLSLGVALTTLALTVAFHFLFAPKPFGFAFAIFLALVLLACHVVAVLAGRISNPWAYAFLGPIVLVMLAQALYANEVMRALSFPVAYASLVFFSYWLTAPHTTLREVPSLWPTALQHEVVIPVNHGSGVFRALLPSHHSRGIFMGIALAIPFIIFFGALFASADPLFYKVLSNVFIFEPNTIGRLLSDLIFAVIVGRILWAMLTRSVENRHPTFRETSWDGFFNKTTIAVFLGLLNLLFLLFIGFQLVYFLGGEEIVKQHGLTYAEYAREGFFQLLVVAGLVFLIAWAIYQFTEMREWLTKGLTFALILETGLVIVSAVKRLTLYIDTYGLTVARWWAMAVILFIAAILLAIILGALAKQSYSMMAKALTILTLYVFAGLILVNVEGMVVKWNGEQFLSGKTTKLDLRYLMDRLSNDATPSLVALGKSEWPSDPPLSNKFCVDRRGKEGCTQDWLLEMLRARADYLRELNASDWRNLVISDYRAMAAIATLAP